MISWRWGAIVALAVLLAPAATRAANPEHVILVRSGPPDPVLAEALVRLEAEIRLAGFEPESKPLRQDEPPLEELKRVTEQSMALATLALVRHNEGTTIEVFISDHNTGRTLIRSFPAAAAEPSDLLALRAVESFLATLREFRFVQRTAQSEQRPVVEPSPGRETGVPVVPSSPSPEPGPQFELRAAIAGLQSVRAALSPSFGPSLSLAYRPRPSWAVRAVTVGPEWGSKFVSDRGSASITQGLGLMEGEAQLFERGSLRLALVAGAGAYYLRARGAPSPPTIGRTSSVWAFAAEVGLDAAFSASSRFDLVGAVRSVFLTPLPVVAILETERLMGPSIVFLLGGQVHL